MSQNEKRPVFANKTRFAIKMNAGWWRKITPDHQRTTVH